MVHYGPDPDDRVLDSDRGRELYSEIIDATPPTHE